MSFYYDRSYLNIKYRSCFFEQDAGRDGYTHFYSADPGFPLSLAYPSGMGPFFDISRRDHLLLDFGGGLWVIRDDLRSSAERGDTGAALVLARPSRVSAYLHQQFKDGFHHLQRKQHLFAGEQAIDADVFVYGSDLRDESIAFVAHGGLWWVDRRPRSCVPDDIFDEILKSMVWLDDTFYRRLSGQQAARELVRGRGRLLSVVLMERVERRVETARVTPDEWQSIFGSLVRYLDEPLPDGPSWWHEAGHFELRHPRRSQVLRFGAEGPCAATIIDLERDDAAAEGRTIEDSIEASFGW
jgi:hypothetical protein